MVRLLDPFELVLAALGLASRRPTFDLGQRSVALPMERQQGAVAESAEELEVLCP